MRLKSVHVKEFQSVWDSNEFDVGDVTCLVGKNEAGKTAILKALYRLNPLVETDAKFDVTEDYPRAYVKDYMRELKAGGQQATVVEADFALDLAEREMLETEFGKGIVPSAPEVNVSRGYDNTLYYSVAINEQAAVVHFVTNAGLVQQLADSALKATTLKQLADILQATSAEMSAAVAAAQLKVNEITDADQKAAALAAASTLGEPPAVKTLRDKLSQFGKESLEAFIWKHRLAASFPKFLYFDEYYQMEGQVNVDELNKRQAANTLKASDHPMLGLISLADLEIDQLLNSQNTQELKNQLEGAGNYLSRQILKYWSQNKHISLRFDVRPAKPGDPMGLQSGTNLWAEVYDSAHLVTVRVGTRSRGSSGSFRSWPGFRSNGARAPN